MFDGDYIDLWLVLFRYILATLLWSSERFESYYELKAW